MTDTPMRVRFCPSPTGIFHVGGSRTALFNWLLAKHHGGTFVLRIEDTDEARNHPDWTEGIFSALRWMGIDWDELYYQSANADRHREAALRLHAEGKAYYCDCTADDVQARKTAAGEKTPGYDEFCADRGLEAGPGRALRFRVPNEGTITRSDVIRGTAEIELATIEDFVILRANGSPMFILANAFDDADQRVTHVVRGEEHLSNVPKQLLLWEALGAGPSPIYAHVPVIVNEKGKKLSKRRDKVAQEMYRDEGYLPEAMRNYLGTLGWSPRGDREIITLREMIDEFRLEDVTASPAQFDEKKLAAFNGEYIRALTPDDFVTRSLEWYRQSVLGPLAPLLQERAQRLPDALAMTDFLVTDTPAMDATSWDKTMGKEHTKAILESAAAAYATCEWTAEDLHAATLALGDAVGLALGKAQAPIRVAVTGRTVGPPLFESLVVLGRDRTLARLQAALRRVG